MPEREPLAPATQPKVTTPLTAKRVAFQVGAVTIAIGVTTWLACSAETPSPSPNATTPKATAPKTPPTAPKAPAGDINAASSQRAVDAPATVAPATKFMVLPDTKKTAPKNDAAKNNANDNKRPAFDVMPATKSGRIDRETLERMYKRDKDSDAKRPPPPPVFPGTKAAVLPSMHGRPVNPDSVEQNANEAPTQATKRRRSRRRRSANAPNPPPQQQAAPQAQSAD